MPAWEIVSSGGQDRQGGQKKGRSPGEDQALITISEAFTRIGRSSVVDIEPLQLRNVPFGLCMACLVTRVCCVCAFRVPSVRRDDGVVVIGAEHNWLAIRIECQRPGYTQAAAAAGGQLTEKITPKNPDGGEQGRNDTVEEKDQQEDTNAKSNIRNVGGSFVIDFDVSLNDNSNDGTAAKKAKTVHKTTRKPQLAWSLNDTP